MVNEREIKNEWIAWQSQQIAQGKKSQHEGLILPRRNTPVGFYNLIR